MADPSMMYPVPSVMGSPSDSSQVRVVQSRPKPQCWEHGCNGRQFSTFSNLLRHQREKSDRQPRPPAPTAAPSSPGQQRGTVTSYTTSARRRGPAAPARLENEKKKM